MGTKPQRVEGGTLVPRLVFVPTGTRLSNSSTTPGAAAGVLHTKRTGKLVGPAKSFPINDPASKSEASPNRAPLGDGGGQGLTVRQEIGLQALSTVLNVVVQEGMERVVLPAASRQMKKVVNRFRKRRSEATPENGPMVTTANSSHVAELAVMPSSVEMTTADYRERLLRLLMAESLVRSEQEFLAHAVLSDSDLDPALAHVIRQVQAGNLNALEEAELDLLSEFLRGTPTSDGRYELVGIERPELEQGPS
jgi:hypothetical protein